jgi:uncharacterized protein (TIGR02217 family)
MNFHDVLFPAALSMGSTGGPERRTDIVALANGHESRNAPWAHARRRYDAGLGLRSRDDLHAVLSFFEARMGRLYAFRWRDWADDRSCAPSQAPRADDCVLGRGDGATRAFQLSKTYEPGPHAYIRPIDKPVVGSVLVAVDGAPQAPLTDFTVDHATGRVALAVPPAPGAAVTAGFRFDVPARFDADRIEISIAAFDAGAIPSIPVIEVRV